MDISTGRSYLKSIARIGKILNSEVSIEERLEITVKDLSNEIHIEGCSIFLNANKESNYFTLIAQTGLDDYPDYSLEELENEFISHLSIPCIHSGNHLAELSVWSKEERFFGGLERDFLRTIASQIAIALDNNELYSMLQRKVDFLTNTLEIGKELTKTDSLEDLFTQIVQVTAYLTGGRRVVLRLVDEEHEKIKIRAAVGLDETLFPDLEENMNEGVAGYVVKTGRPLFIEDIKNEEKIAQLSHLGFISAIFVPLIVDGNAFGTLSVYDKLGNHPYKQKKFSEEDFELVKSFASQAAIVTYNKRSLYEIGKLSKKNQKQASELVLLYQLSKIISGTLELDKMLYLILTCLTIGDGLGFNRAALFLMNPDTETLEGKMALGPDDSFTADKIWNTLKVEDFSLQKISTKNLDFEIPDKINQFVKQLSIPINSDDLLIQSLKSGKIIRKKSDNVEFAFSPFIPKDDEFVLVPLISKGKELGVILVDNAYTHQRISEKDISLLYMFSEQVALAVDSARIHHELDKTYKELKSTYGLLLQKERMTVLGEMAALVAHEIKNPLVPIGGFARRIMKHPSSSPKAKEYAEIVINESARLELLLKSLTEYADEQKLEIGNIDLNAVLKKSMEIATMENSYKIKTNFWQDKIQIQGDKSKLQNCFLNIMQTMIEVLNSEDDEMKIETKLIATEKDCIRGLRRKCKAALPECQHHGCVSVKISVENGYISRESLEQLFNPFDSSKDKKTRIRLPISKKIINLHKGNISISSQKGQGTIAQIVLPMEHSENTDKENNG